jgi:hypothetical protein
MGLLLLVLRIVLAAQAGYACPAGSSSPTTTPCAAGTYSLAGSGTCTNCPAGTFGSTTLLSSAACSGACAAGRYGDAAGQLTNQCVGACAAGYACPAGSTSATATSCPAGSYSTGGQGSCTLCPPGTFGSTVRLTSAACSGLCAAGKWVPARASCHRPDPFPVPCSHASSFRTTPSMFCAPCCPVGALCCARLQTCARGSQVRRCPGPDCKHLRGRVRSGLHVCCGVDVGHGLGVPCRPVQPWEHRVLHPVPGGCVGPSVGK